MYNAHWIHSLPYSKFIELTLIYVVSRNMKIVEEKQSWKNEKMKSEKWNKKKAGYLRMRKVTCL